jgi:hypothetical protein
MRPTDWDAMRYAPGHCTTWSGLVLRRWIVIASPARVNIRRRGDSGGHGVGRSTSTGLVATIAFNVAVTIARPSPLAVTTPKGLTVTTLALDDDQPTVAVASSTWRSDSVTSALSCDVSPLRLKLALPSIESDMAMGTGVGLTEDFSPHATAEMATRTRRPRTLITPWDWQKPSRVLGRAGPAELQHSISATMRR